MKFLLLILFLSISLPASASEKFVSKDLGFELLIDDEMRWLYNSHSMRKTPIYLGEEYIGGFTVSAIPDSMTPNEFIEYGASYYRDKYPSATISSDYLKNDNQLGFYKVSAKYRHQEKTFVDERFIFVKLRPSIEPDTQLYLTYTFNYKYSEARAKEIENALLSPITSFNFIENSPITNEAIRIASNKQTTR